MPNVVTAEVKLVMDEAQVVSALTALDNALRTGGVQGSVVHLDDTAVACAPLSAAVDHAEAVANKSVQLSRTLVWAKAVLDVRLAVAAGNWDRVAAIVDSVSSESSAGL